VVFIGCYDALITETERTQEEMEIKPTLLLVEDDLNDAALFKIAFGKSYPNLGLQMVNEANDAMHYLRGDGPYEDRQVFPFPYAMVVDLTLPGTSGASFIQWVRVQPQFGKLLIAAWTGSRQGKDIAHLYRLGANSFLNKAGSDEQLTQDLLDLHEFWHQVGMLVNFRPQIDYSKKTPAPAGDFFFYRTKDWPEFKPSKTGE
jgi:CheY-like chemotaxis protein